MEVLLCERVNDLRHSLFHLLNCLITIDSELMEQPKVTGSKVWTTGRLRNCLDAHLGQIVCDKDGVVSCWKCHWPDLKSAGLFWRNLIPNFNIETLTLTLTLWPINSGVLTSLLLPYLSPSLTDSLPSLNLLCHSKTDARFVQHGRKAVTEGKVWTIGRLRNCLDAHPFLPSSRFNSILAVLLRRNLWY